MEQIVHRLSEDNDEEEDSIPFDIDYPIFSMEKPLHSFNSLRNWFLEFAHK